MKLQEAMEFLRKNPTKTLIENTNHRSVVVCLRAQITTTIIESGFYDKDRDNFDNWEGAVFNYDLLDIEWVLYERKFILSDHKFNYHKKVLFKPSEVRECYHEIVRKINEKVKPQLANGFEFINKKDTMRIIKETFGDLE